MPSHKRGGPVSQTSPAVMTPILEEGSRLEPNAFRQGSASAGMGMNKPALTAYADKETKTGRAPSLSARGFLRRRGCQSMHHKWTAQEAIEDLTLGGMPEKGCALPKNGIGVGE